MNNRQRKKIEKMRRERVLKLVDLAMKKNEGKATVFLSFSGHVNAFSLYRKFLKSLEIVYNVYETKNDMTKERRE